ncbi:MAG: hypothetical protein MUO76_07910 [Anaerolineaceae bacterium]|nr:hypothetical protein [Anaerolineaceae bacterium]
MNAEHKFQTMHCLFIETRSADELAARRQVLKQKREDHTGIRAQALGMIATFQIAAGCGLHAKLNQNAGLNA